MVRVNRYFFFILGMAFLLGQNAVAAEKMVDDPVLVSNGETAIHLSEYQAELLRMPEKIRTGFANNKKRIEQLLGNLLENKTIAAQAKKIGLDKKPEVAMRLELERRQQLARIYVNEIGDDAAVEFDKRQADFLVKAKEQYFVNKAQYESPAQVKASHILIGQEQHSEDEGRALAEKARQRILAGEDFAIVADSVSEDATVKTNHGELGWFDPKTMVPAFSKAVSAMKKIGELSEPVKTEFGWHIIRFEGERAGELRSFDEVKGKMMEAIKEGYVEGEKNNYLSLIRYDPSIRRNEEAIDKYVLIKAPPKEVIKKMLDNVNEGLKEGK